MVELELVLVELLVVDTVLVELIVELVVDIVLVELVVELVVVELDVVVELVVVVVVAAGISDNVVRHDKSIFATESDKYFASISS